MAGLGTRDSGLGWQKPEVRSKKEEEDLAEQRDSFLLLTNVSPPFWLLASILFYRPAAGMLDCASFSPARTGVGRRFDGGGKGQS